MNGPTPEERSAAIRKVEDRLVSACRGTAAMVEEFGIEQPEIIAEQLHDLEGVLSLVLGFTEDDDSLPASLDLLSAVREFLATAPQTEAGEALASKIGAFLSEFGIPDVPETEEVACV